MASAITLPPPSTDRYSTFRRRSTLEGPEYDNTGTPVRLIAKMKDVRLPITKPVRDFAHTMTKELQEEEKRSKDATDAINSLSERFLALEKQMKEIPKLRQQVEEIPKLRQQVEEIPKLQQQIPELRERIQELEDESEKTRGVTTKGRYATFRELIQ
jgi:chromosome segregation ATPase